MTIKLKTPYQPNSVLNLFEQIYGTPEPEISKQLQLLNEIVNTGILPTELLKEFKFNNFRSNMKINILSYQLREMYISDFGFVLLNDSLVNSLGDYLKDKKTIEVGAGTGWLSHNLQKLNVDITPIDLQTVEKSNYFFTKEHTTILNISAEKYLLNSQYDSILMSWPNYESDFAFNVLNMMPKGKKLIYIGESYGGCTANDAFFELLNEKCSLKKDITESLQAHTTRWSGMHDDIYVYEINK